MNTQKQKNLEKLIFDTLDKEIEGIDIYNHNGSMWIIFTEEKRWVVEFTKEKTLWYNYYIFNNIMMLFGMDNKETAEYVKKWFENRFLFKPKIVDTIQNGVKPSTTSELYNMLAVGDIIQNGVKSTKTNEFYTFLPVGDIIQNGVKSTTINEQIEATLVGDIIQNGVKSTKYTHHRLESLIEDTIQNGVKSTISLDAQYEFLIEEVINEGVKNTKENILSRYEYVEDTIQNGVKNTEGIDFNEDFDDVIKNGVKVILPAFCEYETTTKNIIKNGVKF